MKTFQSSKTSSDIYLEGGYFFPADVKGNTGISPFSQAETTLRSSFSSSSTSSSSSGTKGNWGSVSFQAEGYLNWVVDLSVVTLRVWIFPLFLL